MINECEVVAGLKIGRGYEVFRGNLPQMPLCLVQIPHDLTWHQAWVAVVGSSFKFILDF
jgi:hypothetical protein